VRAPEERGLTHISFSQVETVLCRQTHPIRLNFRNRQHTPPGWRGSGRWKNNEIDASLRVCADLKTLALASSRQNVRSIVRDLPAEERILVTSRVQDVRDVRELLSFVMPAVSRGAAC
jgi:hypothetical protein